MRESIGYQGLPAVYKEMHGGSLKEADTAIRNTIAVILQCLYEGKSVKFLNEFTISAYIAPSAIKEVFTLLNRILRIEEVT